MSREPLWASGAPVGRRAFGMAWSTAADGFYVFGGANDSTAFDELWLYGRAANSWQQLAVSGAPSPQERHAVAFSDAEGLYVFGGRAADGGRLNDLHRYSPVGSSWQAVTPNGTPPSARSGAGMVWSWSASGLYLFGGTDGSA